MRRRRKLMFAAMTCGMLLLLLEAVLHLATAISTNAYMLLVAPPRRIRHPQFGAQPNPAFPGHDAWGFGNRSVPQQADIVAFGDSQTFGWTVAMDEAWPHRVGALGGVSVYDMGTNGYAPPHNLMLLDKAMSLQPRIVLTALYSGNDLWDSYNYVYPANKLTSLRTTDADVLARIAAAEAHKPFLEHVLWYQARGNEKRYRAILADHRAQGERRRVAPIHRWMSRNVRVYGLARAVWHGRLSVETELERRGHDRITGTWHYWKRQAAEEPGFLEVVDHGNLRTILTPAYRTCPLNLDDVRMAAALDVICRAILICHERASRIDARHAVVLIPTKELVFAELCAASAQGLSPQMASLVEHETRMRDATRAFLEAHEIAYIDTLPALRDCLLRDVNPYHHTHDGHPNAAGHEAMAQAVYGWLIEHQWIDVAR